MSHANAYHFFWTGPFSQWHPSEFMLWEHRFATAEQAMMYGKARLFDDEGTARAILAATDPGKQKALGRQVRGFDQGMWDAHKQGIVTEISLSKFSQNKGLRRKLFQTQPKHLAEASPLDTIWGIGLDSATAALTPPDQWPGQNLLGRILTDVRTTLAQQFPEEAASVARAGDTSESTGA